MSKIYFYKLTVDDGGAPCVKNGLLTLAICKPMIRMTARKGDIVLGFAANSLHSDNRLIYVARVTDRLTNGDYFTDPQYAKRADCIYQWQGGRFGSRPGSKYHGSPSDLVHDLGAHSGYPRANTLLSGDFCYFGASGSDAYKRRFPAAKLAVETLGRGHRVFHDPVLEQELVALSKLRCPLQGPSVEGKPTSESKRHQTHRGGGCGVTGEKQQRRSCH